MSPSPTSVITCTKSTVIELLIHIWYSAHFRVISYLIMQAFVFHINLVSVFTVLTGFTHLLMDGVSVCMHATLSYRHPIYKLLRPHFQYMHAINEWVHYHLLARSICVSYRNQRIFVIGLCLFQFCTEKQERNCFNQVVTSKRTCTLDV